MPRLCLASLLVVSFACGCTTQQMAKVVVGDAGTSTFQIDPPTVYVAKVKNLLVGLPPTDAEIAAVTADPSALDSLVDGWMALPEYQQKMKVFFELAFQQTQITAADFVDTVPQNGIGDGSALPTLVQNARESFARTVLALVAAGQPLTDAFTTKQLMMTPALMELYAFLDTRHADDTGAIKDSFAAANPMLKIYSGTAMGPIPIAQTLDPTSANYMHWYSPDVASVMYPVAGCDVDPIVYPASSFAIHQILYGAIDNHKVGTTPCGQRQLSAASVQLQPSDFTTWKMVTLRPPAAQEAITTFYDLPALRSATELVLNTPHPGFFSTPAFFANWPTNQSNQMRVTVNQALIVSTGLSVDGNDTTTPATTPGLDAEHSATGGACFSCHQLLDPTRSILSSTYSWFYDTQTDPALIAQPGLFAFEGVITPVKTIDDFASTLASHPAVPTAWAQKLCYYFNSAPCALDDKEFIRIVGLFKQSNFSWSTLVKAVVTSPITTHTAQTDSSMQSGEVIAVTRRDHLCAALDNRLGLTDVCGLDVTTKRTTAIPQIVSGLPSDGYGRGATIPVLPNQPTPFYRAGLENICETVSALVIDPTGTSVGVATKTWSSTQPDAAIADFVSIIMALTTSDARTAPATALLQSHFTSALKQGGSATAALRSTFITACLAPSSIGIGM